MKIALIGYGKMGHQLEQLAIQRGHSVVSIIDVSNPQDFDSLEFKNADVAIEFSTPDSAIENYRKCFAANVPVVAGTTGWLQYMDEVKQACQNGNQTFFYSSNYSLGVNVFFALNTYLAKIMDRFAEYNVAMKETHHIHKLDAPSGTAITLAEGIFENLNRKQNWTLEPSDNENDLTIECFREGEVPGIHEVIYQSIADTISIKHDAKSRIGFALGAIMAAEFTYGKKGFITMDDMLKF